MRFPVFFPAPFLASCHCAGHSEAPKSCSRVSLLVSAWCKTIGNRPNAGSRVLFRKTSLEVTQKGCFQKVVFGRVRLYLTRAGVLYS